MSRTKFAGKKATLADLPIAEKWRILRYGEKCDPDALAAIRAIHNAIFMKVFPPDSGQISAMYKDEAWEIITAHYRADWGKHDGSFFRALADAMEVHQRIVDPAYARSGGEIQRCEASDLPLPTLHEMRFILADAEIEVTLKTVGRGFKFWGKSPTPMRRGAKSGQKRRHVHRARN